MTDRVKIHERVSGKYLEREDWWWLVREDTGRCYVVHEGFDNLMARTRRGPVQHRVAIKTILAQRNELSAKLQRVLDHEGGTSASQA